jgi:hypothetical protein
VDRRQVAPCAGDNGVDAYCTENCVALLQAARRTGRVRASHPTGAWAVEVARVPRALRWGRWPRMEPKDSEHIATAVGLRQIRRRRRVMLAVVALTIPAMGVLGYFVRSIVPLVWPCWIVLIAVSAYRLGQCRCPRCGRLFHSNAHGQNIFSSECLNCQLPLHERHETA